jgi:hypothetical protein
MIGRGIIPLPVIPLPFAFGGCLSLLMTAGRGAFSPFGFHFCGKSAKQL